MRLLPPHLPGTPPPPQNVGLAHVPQLGVSPPHPSACCPHAPAPKLAHVFATQVKTVPPSAPLPLLPPHLLGPPPPQNAGLVHVPHRPVEPPQPSPATPQLNPWSVQLLGVHVTDGPPSAAWPLLPPHLFAPPPPQYCGLVHVPVALPQGPIVPPQPSPAEPHV